MSLDITSGQELATQRRTLYGAVYVLSGTLLSRVSGLDSAPIRWATRTFSGGPSGELYEAYLGPPDTIQEELAFKLGEPSPSHPVNIPVRNLPFRHADSLLAALVDEDYAWEGSTATLYVGYLQPGQEPEDLAPEDWTTLRKLGQLGAPRDVQQDGFRLPLLPRDSLRQQTLSFTRARREDWPNLDPLDEGRVIPLIVGSPDSWVRMIRVNAGVYGLTTRSTLSGTSSSIQIQSNFTPAQVSGLSGQEVYLHRQDKVLTVASVTQGDGSAFELDFGSTLDFNIPQGALVQEKLAYYEFLPAAQPLPFSSTGGSVTSGTASGNFSDGIILATAFETLDGRVIPFATTSGIFDFVMAAQAVKDGAPFSVGSGAIPLPSGVYTVWRMWDTLVQLGTHPFQPPALIPRLNLPSAGAEVVSDDVTITAQPEFAPSISFVSATKQNFPTGPGTAAAAFDGSLNTGYSLGAFGSVTFTFPSVPGGTFTDGDTVRSILRFTSQGILTYSDGLNTFHTTTAASKDSYTIVLGAPEDFNQSVLVTAGVGGGIIYEISWEHELEAELTVDRVTDVAADAAIVLSSAEDVGFDMVPIKGILVKIAHSNTSASSFAQSPWRGPIVSGVVQAGYGRRCLPTSVFANLQKKYLEDGGDFSATSGDYSDFINAASYAAAEAEYTSRDIRFNFAITEPMGWADLERQLALQSRSHAFYGPAGHQLIVIPDSSEAEQSTVEASFFLPGTPNPNVSQAQGQPLIERTSPSEIINRVDAHWGRQWHVTTAGQDESERYLYLAQGLSQPSRDVFGDRYDVAGPILAWAIHDINRQNFSTLPVYSGETQAQDLADFIADRQGFAKTRFVFEAAWPTFGLTQGSVVRVAFAAAPGVYRNVVCEVEDIQTSPINAERRILTVRSLGGAQRGLEPALIWTDLFTEQTDTWASRITGARDRWQHYFGVPE